MSLKILKNYSSKHTKMALWSIIFMGIFSISYTTGFAAGEAEISAEDMKKVTSILNGFIMGAAALMGMVTSFITIFLYPGWINGTWFGLDLYLKEIWVLISNIVYFIFAFILIAIAFMNIIGKGEGNWELKQAMPKFIIGILIVPFSWFFVQFVLSISSVLTVGVLTLPYESFQGESLYSEALEKQEWASEDICKDVVISFSGDFEGQKVQSISSTENGLDENIKCKEGSKLSIKELLTGIDSNGNVSSKSGGLQNSIFGVISIYSYGILKIHDLDTITGKDLESIKTIADLIFKIVFDLLFIAVYLLLMIALLLALFVRGVRLWIYAMLSPVFGLLYFFNASDKGFGDTGKHFNIKEFIALALVPVYVSAALAFGLTFILLASTGIQNQSDNVDTLEAGGFSLTLVGAHGSGDSEESVIGKLIVEIFGVVILWIAVMAALGASEVTRNIVEPINSFGKSMGELAAKAPTYAPIIPTGSGGISAEGLKQIGSSATQYAAGIGRESGEEFMKNKGMFGNKVAQASSTAAAIDAINAKGANHPDSIKLVRDAIKQAGNVQSITADPKLVQALKDVAKGIGMTDEKWQKAKTQGQIAELVGEIDYTISQNSGLKSQVGDFLVGFDERGSAATTGKIDDAISGTDSVDTSATETNNTTVNVEIGGKTMTAEEAVKSYDIDTKSALAAKLSAEVAAKNISDNDKNEILKAFDRIDIDNDGSIND